MRLPERLKALASYIESGAAVADIGTDHGLLPVYLAKTGTAGKIIASDISSGSLRAAIRTADKYGVTEAITFIVAPGLDGVTLSDVDTVVIAGLGGETIIDILDNAPLVKSHRFNLILQPQTKTYMLFRYLYDNDYMIRHTKIIREKNRRYTIINAKWTVTQ